MKTIRTEEILAEFILKMNYGDILRRQDIERITGTKYGPGKFYYKVDRAKAIIKGTGKAIRSCGGGDYQVLYPGDFSKEYRRGVTNAAKRIRENGELLATAPVGDMTDEERVTHRNLLDFNTNLCAKMVESTTTVHQLVREKPHPLKEAYGK